MAYTRYKFYVIELGTGSLLARDLPKLLLGTSHKMMLLDGDTVESKNIERQGYQAQDVGDNKALALSRKKSTLFIQSNVSLMINIALMKVYLLLSKMIRDMFL